jgi:hydrogenase-4 component F
MGVSFYNISYLKNSSMDNKWSTYYSIFLLMFIASMSGVILSTHFGLLWVFVEATTLTSAPLIYVDKTKSSLEATWKYIFICSIGIAIAFVGINFLTIGSKNLDSLFFDELCSNAGKINLFWLKLAFIFILVGFGMKVGLAPVHAWLPDAHSESPAPISAMLSGTLLNAAILGILRMVKLMKLANVDTFANTFLLIMGFLSILVSAAFLIRVKNYKRMLAYSSIENMGIITIGVGLGGIGIFASILHMFAHSLAKASFFLTSGNIYKRLHTKQIDEVSGLISNDRITGWVWILCFACIVAIPPFPTFISELLMIQRMVETNNIVLLVIFLLLLTIVMVGMGKSVMKMFLGKPRQEEEKIKFSILNYLPQIIFLIILVIIGLYIPNFIHNIIEKAVKYLGGIE